MAGSTLKEVTGSDAGHSGEDQIKICLRRIVELGGVAQMQDLYAAMEAELNPLGMTLSEQGKTSLRFFINSRAVEKGYLYPHDGANPGWRITPEGETWLKHGGSDNKVIQRLEQWKLEATDPQHANHAHANLDQPFQIHAAITGLLDKLRTAPEDFDRQDAVALFGQLNSGQRMKSKAADGNPLPNPDAYRHPYSSRSVAHAIQITASRHLRLTWIAARFPGPTSAWWGVIRIASMGTMMGLDVRARVALVPTAVWRRLQPTEAREVSAGVLREVPCRVRDVGR